MKKLTSLIAILALMLFLAACSSSEETGKKDDGNKNADDKKQEEITLSYANWNLGTEEEMNIERLMIQEFENKNPHINIEIFEISGDWNEQLAAAASAGNMPDVFAISDLPLAITNDWVLDVTYLAEEDSDFANVPQVVRQSTEFDSRIMALPSGQHFLGFYINKDLFNEANIDILTSESTIEEFTVAAKEITDINQAKIGITDTGSIPDWYTASVNPDLGWFTFNGEGYALESSEFINGVNLAKDFATNGYAYSGLTDEQKANFTGEHAGEAWLAGQVALAWDGTWAMSNLVENAPFEFDFIGIPGGRTVITNDLLGISKSAEHVEAAFEFTKFMTFSKEGFMKRLEFADEKGTVISSLPIIYDQEVLDEYFARLDVPGVRKAFDELDTAILEPVKTVPGYVQSRWQAPTGIKIGDNENAPMSDLINEFITGDLKIEDYASEINRIANDRYQEALDALK